MTPVDPMVGGGCEAGFPKGGRAVGDPGTLTGSLAPVQAGYPMDLAGLEIFAGKRPKIQSVLSLRFAVGPICELGFSAHLPVDMIF